MSVYVDELFDTAPYRSGFCGWRWKQSCHLWADSEAELDEFASRLNLNPSWKQRARRLVHFDLTSGKRIQALKLGAISISLKEWVKNNPPKTLSQPLTGADIPKSVVF
jgi:hypothetical protein